MAEGSFGLTLPVVHVGPTSGVCWAAGFLPVSSHRRQVLSPP